MSEDYINLENKPEKKKDTVFSILVIILVLILVFGFVALREYSAKEILSTASERIIEQVEERFPPAEEEPEEEVEEEEVEVAVQRDYYTQEAQRGEGLTHLARRALTDYMQEEEIHLTSEERVYIEDYVQKRLPTQRADRWLDLGEEVEISRNLIEEAVSQAEMLTPAQINNLSQYAALAAF